MISKNVLADIQLKAADACEIRLIWGYGGWQQEIRMASKKLAGKKCGSPQEAKAFVLAALGRPERT